MPSGEKWQAGDSMALFICESEVLFYEQLLVTHSGFFQFVVSKLFKRLTKYFKDHKCKLRPGLIQ
jgi:hypothetical protein